jgi:hypothetical protein
LDKKIQMHFHPKNITARPQPLIPFNKTRSFNAL